MSGAAMGQRYSHLSLEERCRLRGMMEMRLSISEIGRRLELDELRVRIARRVVAALRDGDDVVGRAVDEKLRDIERDFNAHDGASLYRTAHAIKSMSANIGADKVRSISSQIEKKSRENEWGGLAEEIIVLTEAYHEFVEQFDTTFAR